MVRGSPLKCEVRRGWLTRRALLKTLACSLGGGPLLLSGCTNPAPGTHVVEMVSDGGEEFFEPDRLYIRPGDTVRWVLDSGFHSTTAYHPDNSGHPLRIPEGATPWDSGLIRRDGEQFEVTFEYDGVYCYYCTPHEALAMIGMVVVGKPQAGEPGMLPPQDGLPKSAKEKLTELMAWATQL